MENDTRRAPRPEVPLCLKSCFLRGALIGGLVRGPVTNRELGKEGDEALQIGVTGQFSTTQNCYHDQLGLRV